MFINISSDPPYSVHSPCHLLGAPPSRHDTREPHQMACEERSHSHLIDESYWLRSMPTCIQAGDQLSPGTALCEVDALNAFEEMSQRMILSNGLKRSCPEGLRVTPSDLPPVLAQDISRSLAKREPIALQVTVKVRLHRHSVGTHSHSTGTLCSCGVTCTVRRNPRYPLALGTNCQLCGGV